MIVTRSTADSAASDRSGGNFPGRLAVALVWIVAVGPGCGRQQEEGPPAAQAALRLEPAPSLPAPARRPPPFVSEVESSAETPVADVPNHSKLPVYDLKIERRDVMKLEQSAYSNETVPATFTCNGEVYGGVQVRYRGAWARSWPKKPLKIFFPKEKPFEGQRCLNLNSGWHDPAFLRETLAFYVYGKCGAPASRSKIVRVHFNGKFRGLYVQVEQPDKPFLEANHLKGAAIYKAVSRSRQADERELGGEREYPQHYEKQTKKSENYEDLAQFCRELAQSADVYDFFTRRVDLDKYVNYLASTALVQNWDGFNKNHFLVHDIDGTGKWFPVPWDLDRTFGDHWSWSFEETRLSPLLGVRRQPGVTGWNRLQERFFSHPKLREMFFDRLTKLLETEFTPEKLDPVVDELAGQISEEIGFDRRRWPVQDPDFKGSVNQVKQFIRARREYLLGEIPRLRKG